MTIRKTWCLILLASASLVAAASATVLTSKDQQNKLQSEGGAPVRTVELRCRRSRNSLWWPTEVLRYHHFQLLY